MKYRNRHNSNYMPEEEGQIIENVKVKFLKFCRILNEILFLTKVAFNFSL